MPSFFPEGDAPLPQDREPRSLQKINSLLQSIDAKTGGASGGGLTDAELRATPVPASVSGSVSVGNIAGWNIPTHAYRALGYTSGNLTSVTYKTGGAGGTTVATLTLGYDGSGNLTSLTKT